MDRETLMTGCPVCGAKSNGIFALCETDDYKSFECGYEYCIQTEVIMSSCPNALQVVQALRAENEKLIQRVNRRDCELDMIFKTMKSENEKLRELEKTSEADAAWDENKILKAKLDKAQSALEEYELLHDCKIDECNWCEVHGRSCCDQTWLKGILREIAK